MTDNLGKVRFTYLDYLFKEMYAVKSKYYPDSTFFKKDDKVILELEKSGTLWVLYSVWSNISDMFSYEYNETQQLIKEWMEEQIKSQKVAPTRTSGMYDFRTLIVEEQLKSEEVTPRYLQRMLMDVMEEQLKSVEVTPMHFDNISQRRVEEMIKSEEVTPLDAGSNYLPFMEKQLKSAEVTPLLTIWNYEEMIEEQLKQEEITPRNAIAPPFRWRKLDSVKYAEIKPISNKFVEFRNAERRLESEEITPRQVVNGSFDWMQDQIKLKEITPQVNNKQCFVLVGEQLNYEEQIIPEKTTCFVDSVRWKKIND